jgi:hypothetical protein
MVQGFNYSTSLDIHPDSHPQKAAMWSGPSPPDPPSCLVQRQDTVTVPPLCEPQLQAAALSVIEAAKSQLAELKLADLFSQQLRPDKSSLFISEFLFHWAGVDSKPPEPIVSASKTALHALISDFLSNNPTSAASLSEFLLPVLPCLTSTSDCDELLSRLARLDAESATGEVSERIENLHAQKRRDIQAAFTFCLTRPSGRSNEGDAPVSMSTTKAVVGSEATIHTQDSEDAEGPAAPDDPDDRDGLGTE